MHVNSAISEGEPMRKLELHWQILIAIGFAAIAGYAVNVARASGIEDPSFLGISFISFFDYIGSLFLCTDFAPG